MKAVIINSTRGVDHIGCQLTSLGLDKFLSACGIDIISYIPIRSKYLEVTIDSYKNSNVIFIINGEGTFHSNQPECVRIMNAIQGIEHRCALINSQFYQLSEDLQNAISRLPVVYLRTPDDRKEAKKCISHAEFLPDMIFNSIEIPPQKNNSNVKLITDSHEKVHSRKGLYEILWHRNATWLSPNVRRDDDIKTKNKHYLQILRAMANPTSQNLNKMYARSLEDTLHLISNASLITTGRYHIACLAIMASKPILPLNTNTPKINRLLKSFTEKHGTVFIPKNDAIISLRGMFYSGINFKGHFR